MKLVKISDGTPVKVGDTLTTFRGVELVIQGFQPPAHRGSTGKVYTSGGNFYPSVIGAKFVEED